MYTCLSAARAAASRRNGAGSRGPKTPEGKARSAQNALKHGLRAQKFALVGDEDPEAFAALEQALLAELTPVGALQCLLARRIAAAAWRLERAERIEGELFEIQGEDGMPGWGRLGLALVRDGHGSRAFDTLLRYRGSATAELWRALRLLKALQAEAAPDQVRERAPELPAPAQHEKPIEPKARENPGETASVPPASEPEGAAGLPDADAAPSSGADRPAVHEQPPSRRADQNGCLHASLRCRCKNPTAPALRESGMEVGRSGAQGDARMRHDATSCAADADLA